jgi:alanyl-tRNA synthetase
MDRPVSSDDIRETFLRFFTARQHLRIASASVIPVSDPSLLYINAGMTPLKPYFLGESIPPAPDLCNIQPCIRTIDISDVGDRHHLTFFEMLGSWSVDHYLRDRAVDLAFELLTQGFGFDVSRLYMTVHSGDAELGLGPDEVSAAAWERVGVPRDHIVPLGSEDNFWSAGDTGPCGPCTEVFYDTGPEHGPEYQPGGVFDSTGRYIEIWNAGVFIEYNRLPGGTLERLRFASVDTGSGLERMAMVLQGRESVYGTDRFTPIMAAVRAALPGPEASERDIRVVADHLRAATFILGEGVIPSNEGRGYIPRRLLRTAIAVATRSGAADFDLRDVADVVISSLGPAYPQLMEHRDAALRLLAAEQRDFGQVVRRGLDQLSALDTGPGFRVSGEDAFTLFTTHGMPVDLIRDFAAGSGGSVDEERFGELFAEHRQRSRGLSPTDSTTSSPTSPGSPTGTSSSTSLTDQSAALIAAAAPPPTRFLGYGETTAEGRVLALAGPGGRTGALLAGQLGLAVFDQTPFYAEGGGQVGDTGQVDTPDGAASVLDTQRTGGRYVHTVEVTSGELREGAAAELTVDPARRAAVMRNHSATHLLHAALRRVLGPHVRQAGSLVAPDRLRFDFTHPGALSADEIDEAERLVNAEVLANYHRSTQVKPYAEAVGDGAIAFFGDKYGDQVRVVSFGDVSAELCGGTHVGHTAEIGLFRIVSEGSTGSGTRRIEAVTGDLAVGYTLDRDRLLRDTAARLRVSVDQLPERAAALVARGQRRRSPASQPAALAGPQDVRTGGSGMRYVVVDGAGVELAALPAAARRLSTELDAVAVVLLPDEAGQALRVGVAVRPDAAAGAMPLDAREVLRQVLAVTGGHGGGSAVFAQGGGAELTSPAGVPDLVGKILTVLDVTTEPAPAS